jgi:phospholipase C
MTNTMSRIEHVVVLMLENRSFDHMLGHLPGVNGVTEANLNYWVPGDPSSGAVHVSFDAKIRDELEHDPGHDLDDVREQLYGSSGPDFPDHSSNSGFLANYLHCLGGDPSTPRKRERAAEIMGCFSADTVPVLSRLAREFAVCDAWHSSMPGPTWPNRFFAHAATADGHTGNGFARSDLRTIYHNLSDAGISWAIYFHDIPQALGLRGLWPRKFHSHIHRFGRFKKDAAVRETFPAYCFIEPRYFTLFRHGNDQHPPHDVDRGEELIAAVYSILRHSPAWEQTLFVVTYDEHGGIYDHAPARPLTSPGPRAANGFPFTMSGVRVPAVVVSPLIPAGTVSSRLYDHSSIPATLKERFGLPAFLTARDARATTLSDLVSLDAPRSDVPGDVAVPGRHFVAELLADDTALPPPYVARAAIEQGLVASGPLSDFQESLVELARELEVEGEGPMLRALVAAQPVRTEAEGSRFVQERMERFLGGIDER